MKKILIIIISSLFFFTNLNAESFSLALKKTFNNNTELNAERESLNISEQELNISKGSYLPTVTLSGSKSQEETDKLTNRNGTDATITNVDPSTQSLTITQTLIDFGRGAKLAKSKIGIELAKVLKKEQDILYKSIEAYTGLISANEKLKINRSNVNLLDRQVETDRIRLERGKIALSDVAQSESSLAGAQAKLIQAENEFVTSKLNYENFIGNLNDPELLDKKSIIEVVLPEELNSAIEISKTNNPDLIIAKLEYEQSKKDTTNARSDLTPSATLSFDRSRTDDLSPTIDEREKDTLKATVTWPFYSGGKNYANLKKNKSLELQKNLLLDNTKKKNQTEVASAWSK